ncbi:plasmid pRiA4b ORF-3 family protein [Rhizorhapis sp. SPR117]|uniref:plasmid pRiA4b ORF-3 family protein n=1 Tax=Rhizorhapis sp. SPR117 TaxID=2912611 RepID=UPI00403E60B4
MSKPAPLVAYRLKVSLRDISPMIWRRLLVRSDLTLFGLHRVIQIAFGWEDYHLHAFKVVDCR